MPAVRRKTSHYRDLNLSTIEAAITLYERRLKAAARRVRWPTDRHRCYTGMLKKVEPSPQQPPFYAYSISKAGSETLGPIIIVDR
ncbi:MAG TPA: hypothetical protein VNY25_08495 [Steroidobacteraceae bacterium]|nr:hypothetical protein [Steroidobacteraceae bacterium]